jgi:hypothetical protein
VQLDPSNPHYNGILGTLYIKLKQPEQAVEWLKKAVQFGGADYKKLYEETWKYMQQLKAHNEAKKRVLEQKKQQELMNKNPDGTPKKTGGDDDDDDW